MSAVFRDADLDGRRTDVLVAGDAVIGVGDGLAADEIIDCNGCALLPGLHDHHIHVLALAARQHSLDVSEGDLARALKAAPGTGWIRATGYHEPGENRLDRHLLDALVPDRPVRVQHRSGALWVLNSRALELVPLDSSPDVERDEAGEPTGRLWRYDSRLRAALPDSVVDMAAVGSALASYGITGITDATPDLDSAGLALLDLLPQHVTTLSAAGTGPRKLALRDHDLPALDELTKLVEDVHAAGRPVAVHCVTRVSLLLTLAALESAGAVAGDRIEHASVVPDGSADRIARLGLRVVTQPSFLTVRGDDYIRDVAADDLPCLYPYASLLAAGVPVCASSDAPYGPVDPWQAILSARDRMTSSGTTIGGSERVPARTALDGYLSAADEPGGRPRRIEPGAPADLVLLIRPLDDALRRPSAELVRSTWIGGTLVT
ncbi:amidohydrolase family protein [Trebonia sp.]|uniref:amidohydrolase family protein n=1 Tax=Trebonia sp. TaxID=2767075 RepID=UPI00260DF21B|nr:amidohydrolase family protein [Trebonia sp.]